MTDSNAENGRPRRAFLKTAGVVTTAGLAGCSGGGNETDTTATDTGGGDDTPMDDGTEGGGGGTGSSLSLSIPAASNFDPVQIKDDGSQVVSDHVFSELFTLPYESLEPEAQLVSDYSVSDDGRTYTFQLREDVTFHNGGTLTASDVVYSWERLAASENSQEGGVILNGGFQIEHETTTTTVDGEEQEVYEPGTLAVEAVDETTLEVTLASPFFDALFWFAYGSLSPIPEGIVGDIEGYDGEMSYAEFSSQSPVGTGPYRTESVETGTEVVLAANEQYHGEEPGPDEISLQVVQNTQARYQRAVNRSVQAFSLPNSRFDPSKVSIEETRELGQEVGTYGPLSNDETVNYATWDDAYTAYFIFDCSRVEKPIRQALNYAVNQENFVDQGFRGVGEPAYHQTPPSVYPGGKEAYDRHAEENFPYGYNEAMMDEARTTMEAAGYGPDNRASITLSLYNDRNPDAYSRIADILRSKAESLYLDLTVERAPFNTIISEAVAGNLDMYTLGNGLEYPSPMDMLKFARPYDGNLVRWRENPSDASEQAATAWETVQNNLGPGDAAQQARSEAFIQMEEAVWEDAIYLTNYHPRGQQWWYDDVDVPVQTSGFHDRLYDDVTF